MVMVEAKAHDSAKCSRKTDAEHMAHAILYAPSPLALIIIIDLMGSFCGLYVWGRVLKYLDRNLSFSSF